MKILTLVLAIAFFVASCSNAVVNDNMHEMGDMKGLEHDEMMEHMEEIGHDKMMNHDGMMRDSNFENLCKKAGYEWMLMKPTKDGSIIHEEKSCWGCMVEGIEHVCDSAKYMEIMGLSPEIELKTGNLSENEHSRMEFTITNSDGTPAEPVMSHEMLLHAVIVRDDFSSFSHVHPRHQGGGVFILDYEFTKGGRYVIGTDYATSDGHFSKKFIINVEGDAASNLEMDFSTLKNFAGYDVKLIAGDIKNGRESTIKYYFEKNGAPVIDLEPYLAAPMHVAIIKGDLSEFMHVHGEVHEQDLASGSSHEHEASLRFGPQIEAHVNFPAKGIYNIFGEFKHEGNVVVTSFMVEVK